jgi:hypothetical protein
MHYAVSIADMTKEPLISSLLFSPFIHHGEAAVPGDIFAAEGKDEYSSMAAKLHCTAEEFAGLLLIVRRRYHRNEFRLYQSKTGRGGWKRV